MSIEAEGLGVGADELNRRAAIALYTTRRATSPDAAAGAVAAAAPGAAPAALPAPAAAVGAGTNPLRINVPVGSTVSFTNDGNTMVIRRAGNDIRPGERDQQIALDGHSGFAITATTGRNGEVLGAITVNTHGLRGAVGLTLADPENRLATPGARGRAQGFQVRGQNTQNITVAQSETSEATERTLTRTRVTQQHRVEQQNILAGTNFQMPGMGNVNGQQWMGGMREQLVGASNRAWGACMHAMNSARQVMFTHGRFGVHMARQCMAYAQHCYHQARQFGMMAAHGDRALAGAVRQNPQAGYAMGGARADAGSALGNMQAAVGFNPNGHVAAQAMAVRSQLQAAGVSTNQQVVELTQNDLGGRNGVSAGLEQAPGGPALG